MRTFGEFRPRQTLFFMGNIPMDLTNTLVGAHILSALFTAGVYFFSLPEIVGGTPPLVRALSFTSQNISHFYLWALITYPFIHMPSIWLVVGLFFFWWFGREVESSLGMRTFLILYSLVIVIPPLLLYLFSFKIGPVAFSDTQYIHFMVFVAWVFIYPGALLFFQIPAKWFAAVFITVYTVHDFSLRDWDQVLFLWASLLTTFFVLRHYGVNGCFRLTGWFSTRLGRGRESAQHSFSERQARRQEVADAANEQEVDALLEKIAAQGIQSLTERERRILTRASKKM